MKSNENKTGESNLVPNLDDSIIPKEGTSSSHESDARITTLAIFIFFITLYLISTYAPSFFKGIVFFFTLIISLIGSIILSIVVFNFLDKRK